jgi:hypothetical protein
MASNRYLVVIAIWAGVACGSSGSDVPYAPTGPGTFQQPTPSSSSGVGDGSDGSGGGSGESSDGIDTSAVSDFQPGVGSERILDSLTDAEITDVCQRARDYFASEVSFSAWERAICFGAGELADNAGECSLRVEQCLVNTVFDYLSCSLDALKEARGGTCDMKVGTYARCVTERLAIAVALIEYNSCDRLRPGDMRELPQQLEATPLACEELYWNCPALD